jgi:hypothetical protein
MTKKNLWLILVALGLATVYAIWFSDWFRPKTVGIFHTTRNLRLSFGLSRRTQMTELKVVSVAALETNKAALPVWHLISDSNSVPVQQFAYGQHIGGMRPAISGVRAEPLVPNVIYRMFITTHGAKGQHDFQLQ